MSTHIPTTPDTHSHNVSLSLLQNKGLQQVSLLSDSSLKLGANKHVVCFWPIVCRDNQYACFTLCDAMRSLSFFLIKKELTVDYDSQKGFLLSANSWLT
jgi:hypothetical protein